MMTKIIFAACFIPIWPVIYFIIRNNVKPKKNIILGVTLPHEAHNDPDTQSICGMFTKRLNIVMLPLLPLLAPPFFMETSGGAMTWFMTWLLVLLIAPFTVFAVCRGKLMALKRERGWNSAASGRTLADVKAAAIPAKKINALWFLPPIAVSFVPVVQALFSSAEWGYTFIYLTFAAMTVSFWLLYYLIYRVRTEVVNEDLTLTMALTRVRRYNWSKFWIIASWLTGIANLLLWVFANSVLLFLIVTLGYTVFILIAAVQTEFAARIAQQKLTAGDSGSLYQDEDEYWLLGMFYCNPNDNHFLVNDRVGMNMSVNLAKPAAKVLMAFAALMILAMPFFGIWMWAEETAPATLILSETALTAHHTGDQYVIEMSDITSIDLMERLPSMSRTWGTGFENLYKGNFSVGGYGACNICLQPQGPPFLVIKAGGRTYILNDADSAVTRAVYDTIKASLSGKNDNIQWDDFNNRAEAFVTAMADSDFEAAATMFDTTMKKALPASALQTDVWDVVSKQAGAFVAVHDIENTVTNGYYLCFVTSKHERSGVMLRVVFSKDGLIAGLFIEGYPAIVVN